MAIQNNAPFVRHVGGTEGTTGWSRTDVLSAIEQVLADAGVHGSSTRKSGVLVNCLAPGSSYPYNYNGNTDAQWQYAGGGQVLTPGGMQWNIRLTVSAGDYVLTPIWQPDYIWASGEIRFNRMGADSYTFATNISNGISYDQVSGVKHVGWQTGDSFILRNPNGNSSSIPPELTVGNTYYLIVPDDYDDITETTYVDVVKIATSLANAQAGTAITFANNHSWNTATYDSDINLFAMEFEFPAVTGKLSVRQEDYITFHLSGVSGHPTTLVDTDDTSLTFPGGTYSDVRELKETPTATLTNFESLSYRDMPTGLGSETGRIVWWLRGWTQGDYVLQCRNHTGMQATIEVKPNPETYTATYNKPYWDYEVPASGGRDACTFRVYRRTYEAGYAERGKILGVRVNTKDATGWSNEEVFTIPGNQIGGSTPKHDIVFGVNSSTTQQQNDANAIPSVQVMDIGSGTTNFYARYNQVNSAIIEISNDTNKTYGTTFYGIKLNPANEFELQIGAGVGWRYMNWNPTTSTDTYEGGWSGDSGFDVSSLTYAFNYDNDEDYAEFQYGVGSDATSYPMKVQVWKANNSDPQDPNFFVLQFVQNVAGNDESQLSVYFHKGTVIGNGIWDLNHVWQGGFTSFSPAYPSSEEVIRFETHLPRNYRASFETVDIADSNRALRRCAEWGYLRDSNVDSTSHHSAFTDYANNIFTNNEQTGNVIPYFRDSSYDKSTTVKDLTGDNAAVDIEYTGGTVGRATGGSSNYGSHTDLTYYAGNKTDVPAVIQVSPSANYYKPIKGLPIQNCWAPVPYYLPDDYVVIPFNVTPGATTFHTGDAIEVSASEIYKIIEVKYSVNQTTYDNINSNSCKGIAFCARTT